MKNLRYSIVVAGLVLLFGNAFAQSAPAADLDGIAAGFTGAGSYQPVDSDALEELLEAALPPSQSVFTAAGQLDPLSRAIRTVQAFEGEAERARYLLNVQLTSVSEPPAADPLPILLVEVHRFNLAEAVHIDLTATLPAGAVADLAEFSPGPHVSWRFVMRQIMGMNSLTVAASRVEQDAHSASWTDCGGVDCLQASTVIDELIDWDWLEPLETETDSELLDPAVLLDLLLAETGFDAFSHEALWYGSDEPVLIASLFLETGLSQDEVTEAAIRMGALADDSVEAVWKRLAALSTGSGVSVYPADAFECRRGMTAEGWCL